MPQPQNSRFLTTHWSMVLTAAEPHAPASADALAELCKTYWYPLYAFVRRRGYAAAEAEDLTQEFFARVMEKQYLRSAGPEKGRFRTFLLVCLKRFLANEWDRATAQKRGGGRSVVSIDFVTGDEQYSLEPAHDVTPEKLFERRWALTTLQQVLSRLADEMNGAGKGRLFEALRVYLAADASAPGYAQTAEQLGMTEGAVKVAVHRLRERYRTLLRAQIAATLDRAEDVEQEIAALLEALAG